MRGERRPYSPGSLIVQGIVPVLFTGPADRDRMRVGDRWQVRISVRGTQNLLAHRLCAVSRCTETTVSPTDWIKVIIS